MILLDTNLLTRLTSTGHPHGGIARAAVHKVLTRGEQIAIVPQNLYEFWAAATRTPAANGLGMTTAQASQWLGFFQRRFILLPDRDDLPARWHELVRSRQIKGFRCHDARLGAAMQAYGISCLLTFNVGDFKDLPIHRPRSRLGVTRRTRQTRQRSVRRLLRGDSSTCVQHLNLAVVVPPPAPHYIVRFNVLARVAHPAGVV